MQKGIKGVPEHERPELSPHYDESKRCFKGRIGFCEPCIQPQCSLNRKVYTFISAEFIYKNGLYKLNTRYPCQEMGACAGFIEQMSQLPEGKRLNFTFQDFFEPNMIDHFLQNFTVPANQHNQSEAKTPVGLKSCLTWPRRFVDTVNLNSVRRWNQILKRNYLQKGWDGVLQFDMFSDRPEGTRLAPPDFAEMMYHTETWDETALDDSNWEPPSRLDLFGGQEIVSDGERPFSDGDIESDLDYYDDEPGWNDPGWRRMLENRILQKRAELVRWNELIETDVNRRNLRKREPDPYWNYMLDEIYRLDNLDKLERAKKEVSNKDDGLYEKDAEMTTEEVSIVQNEDEIEEADTTADALNQGFAEADTNESETVIEEVSIPSAEATSKHEEDEVGDQVLWVDGADLMSQVLTNEKNDSAEDKMSIGSSKSSKTGQSQAKLPNSNELCKISSK